ncbi:hypothetical protein RB200_23320 [Streptomyces sp. PmtG]
MPLDEPDFHLDGYEAVTAVVAERFWRDIEMSFTNFTVLAAHHTPDHQHSYYILYDQSVTWGHPGEPQLRALHLTRDTTAHTFRSRQHTPALASHGAELADRPWLPEGGHRAAIGRGLRGSR